MLPHLFSFTFIVYLWVCIFHIVGIYRISFLFSLSFSRRVFPLDFVHYKLVSRDSASCLSFLMPQTCGLCGHLKSILDTHPTCLNCTFCSRFSTCKFCLSWSSFLWECFEQCRAYSTKNKKMGKSKETKEKTTKGFSSRSSRKEQGSKASGKVGPTGQSTCGLDDDKAPRFKPVSSSGGVSKPRGHASEVTDTRNTGKGSELSLLPTHHSTPTGTQPGVPDNRRYRSQVSTCPKSDFPHCETVGLDRDSEVILLSPASPQADLPLGRPVLDISQKDKRSLSPRKDLLKVLPDTDQLMKYRTAVQYKLSLFRHRTC